MKKCLSFTSFLLFERNVLSEYLQEVVTKYCTSGLHFFYFSIKKRNVKNTVYLSNTSIGLSYRYEWLLLLLMCYLHVVCFSGNYCESGFSYILVRLFRKRLAYRSTRIRFWKQPLLSNECIVSLPQTEFEPMRLTILRLLVRRHPLDSNLYMYCFNRNFNHCEAGFIIIHF